MANITYGPIVSGAAGSIGGTTFQRSGGGAIARRRPTPPRPWQAAQRESQALLARASQTWKSLSAADQTWWSNYALTIDLSNSLGVGYHPTGQQAFIWCFCQQVNSNWGGSPGYKPTATGLCIEHAPTFVFAAHRLSVTAFTPSFPTTGYASFTVFRADSRRAFARTHRLFQDFWDDSLGLPFDMPYDVDTGFAAGSLLRLHVHCRFMDDFLRPSLLFKYFVDITV